MQTAPSKPNSSVTIDAGFLSRVYHGDDPAGFAQFVGRAAADPNFFVFALQPDQLGVLEIRDSTHGLGRVAYGHVLAGDFGLLQLGLSTAQRLRCQSFIYPIAEDQPNRPQIERILTRRYGFSLYQHHYLRSFEHGS